AAAVPSDHGAQQVVRGSTGRLQSPGQLRSTHPGLPSLAPSQGRSRLQLRHRTLVRIRRCQRGRQSNPSQPVRSAFHVEAPGHTQTMETIEKNRTSSFYRTKTVTATPTVTKLEWRGLQVSGGVERRSNVS